jgi:hypothetical protein
MPQGNITLQDDLLREMQATARAAGKPVDDFATEILTQYLSRQEAARELRDLSAWGQRHSKVRGERPSAVSPAIAESRLDRREAPIPSASLGNRANCDNN